MEQIVNAGQRILDPEFLLENASSLFGSQRAHPVGLGGLGQETLFERLLFHRRQGRRPTRLSLGADGLEAMIAIHIHPALYESSAAAQGSCDGGSVLTLDGQENGSIAVSLFSIPLLMALLTQLRPILRRMKRHLHLTVPPVFPKVCQMSDPGATLFSQAREKFS
jgi:hypothetical protein